MIMVFISLMSLNGCQKDNKDNATDIPQEFSYQIATGGNSWVVSENDGSNVTISDEGIQHWQQPSTKINTYVKLNSPGELHIGLNAKVAEGSSTIAVRLKGQAKKVTLTNTEFEAVGVETFTVEEPGYYAIEIQGISKSGVEFASVKSIDIGGSATAKGVTYVEDDFYWGRRGPSVHLSYTTPENKDILWFYNEVTIDPEQDVIGSYFMANGFGEGYFGMQVNSKSERRILFSVWSPYDTQNPDDIPEDYKIILLGKGEGVHTGEFGNEGSGGQSYKVFDWEAGNTYKFLLKAKPSENNSTDYTAYFFDPQTQQWNLIAGFRRPHTSTFVTRPHSFLENFVTDTGYLSRMGTYGNQWVYDTQGQWHELTKAKFTADATARKGARLDYAGGVKDNVFYMKNCGFFNETTPIDSQFERQANGEAPYVDFSKLEVPKLE